MVVTLERPEAEGLTKKADLKVKDGNGEQTRMAGSFPREWEIMKFTLRVLCQFNV